MTGSFSKKALGKVTFRCNDGQIISKMLEKAIVSGEAQKVIVKSVGIDEDGDEVSNYEFEWSIKLKSYN